MKVGILGAGASGLACAWLLQKLGIDFKVFEQESYVGGLARSFTWHGFTCDFATHRLFTHDAQVLRELLTLVPMVRHARRSKIWLAGKWLSDPVNILELLYKHPSKATPVARSYFTRPRNLEADSFKSFVTARYGSKLHDFFFAPYTEKLFGIDSEHVSVEWARRKVRIGGLASFFRESSKKHFSYFYYPVQGGYGAITDRFYRDVRERVLLKSPVRRLEHTGDRVTGVIYHNHGEEHLEEFSHVISTIPLPTLGKLLDKDFSLPYRRAHAVYILANYPLLTEYHWLYFMDRPIAINRMVEFKNLSPANQPSNQTVLCAEVTDQHPNIENRVIDDLIKAGLLNYTDIVDTMTKHDDFAYPIYDRRSEATKLQVRSHTERFANLHLLGRAATFEHQELDDVYAGALSLANQLAREIDTIPSIGIKVPIQEKVKAMSKSENPLVYVIILTYNNVDDTIECLDSVQKMDYPNFRTVVVDNGSSDNTPEKIRQMFPDVHIIENSTNLGVPWGFNIGFSFALRAGAEYILMLNNDTVAEPDLLSELIKTGSSASDIGILMPKVLYHDRPTRIWAIGGRHRRFPPAIVTMGLNKPDGEAFNQPRELDYAPSCGLLIHRRAFEQAGLFDPGYFFFFDDWDFSTRVRAQNQRIRFVPTACLYHKDGRTTGKGRSQLYWRVMGESSVRFYRRHGRPVWFSLAAHIGYLMLREFVVRGKWYGFKSFLAGVRSGLEKPLGTPPTWDSNVGYAALAATTEDAGEHNQ